MATNNVKNPFGDDSKQARVEEFALLALAKWGLTDWTFVWDTKALRRYGQCRYRKHEIGITLVMANLNSFEETKDVILHEIAHALTGSGHGHDWMWRRMCIKVGARPERCYTPEARGGEVKTVEGKWKLIIADTGEVIRSYHRQPKIRDWSGRWISGRKAETFGKLQVVQHNPKSQESS